MKRFLIGGIAAVVLLVATLVITSAVTSELEATGIAQVEAKAVLAAKQYEKISRLEGIDFANLALGHASPAAMARVLREIDPTERRKLGFFQCERINGHLEKADRKAAEYNYNYHHP